MLGNGTDCPVSAGSINKKAHTVSHVGCAGLHAATGVQKLQDCINMQLLLTVQALNASQGCRCSAAICCVADNERRHIMRRTKRFQLHCSNSTTVALHCIVLSMNMPVLPQRPVPTLTFCCVCRLRSWLVAGYKWRVRVMFCTVVYRRTVHSLQ